MTDDDLEAVVRAYERWVLAANVSILATSVAIAAAILLYIDGLAVNFLIIAAGAALFVRYVDVSGTHELVTSKSPDTVRAEFLGPNPPPMALTRGRAEEVVQTDEGIECTVSTFGMTRVFGYDAAEEDGDILLTLSRNGESYSKQRLSIRRDGSETVITVSTAVPKQRLTQYLFGKLKDVFYERALATRGYELRPAAT